MQLITMTDVKNKGIDLENLSFRHIGYRDPLPKGTVVLTGNVQQQGQIVPPSHVHQHFFQPPFILARSSHSLRELKWLQCASLCAISVIGMLSSAPTVLCVQYPNLDIMFARRLYFTTFPHPPPTPQVLNRLSGEPGNQPRVRARPRGGPSASPDDSASYYYFTIDDQLLYLSFFQDWGPLNIAMVYKACILIHELLEVCQDSPTHICRMPLT